LKRSLKVTITKVRRREVVSARLETLYVHCPSCGRDVAALSPTLATKLLDLQEQTIDDLAEVGQLHTIEVANGVRLVCTDSLFAS
jgi:hypothetical protein